MDGYWIANYLYASKIATAVILWKSSILIWNDEKYDWKWFYLGMLHLVNFNVNKYLIISKIKLVSQF